MDYQLIRLALIDALKTIFSLLLAQMEEIPKLQTRIRKSCPIDNGNAFMRCE